MKIYRKITGPSPEWHGAEAVAFEVRLSYLPVENRWRQNAVVMVITSDVSSAAAIVEDMYRGQSPLIDQIVIRSRSMDIVIDETGQE